MSNEKQLGLAFIQYSQDYDELLPEGNTTLYSYYSGVGWGGQIYPYIKSTGVYHCPDDPTSPTIATLTGDNAIAQPMSYAYNFHLGAYGYNTVLRTKGTLIAALNAPASTVLLGEI